MRRVRRKDGGAVLVLVLMIMLVMLGLGVMALWLTSGNLQVGGNMNLRMQALYAAEAGLERARAALNGPTAPDLPKLLAGSNGSYDNVPTALDATSAQPNGVGAIMMDGAAALRDIVWPPASFERAAGTADSPMATRMGTFTVWIRNDISEIRRGIYTADENQMVVLRSRGVASDGRTNVVLEVNLVATKDITNKDPTASPGAGGPCALGKNACDDNSSTQYGIVIGKAQ